MPSAKPPASAGIAAAKRPSSAIPRQMSRDHPASDAAISRRRSMSYRAPRNFATLSRSRPWSSLLSLNVRLPCPRSKPEDLLRYDVALNLVRSAVDRLLPRIQPFLHRGDAAFRARVRETGAAAVRMVDEAVNPGRLGREAGDLLIDFGAADLESRLLEPGFASLLDRSQHGDRK